jgi:anhydro-N-acetylmuramic acid kinase
MSGTSMDGIDVAMIKSDGFSLYRPNCCLFIPYSSNFKVKLAKLVQNPSLESDLYNETEKEFVQLNIVAVKEFLKKFNLNSSDIDLIGFHGHTILHQPTKRLTWQIGDKTLLSKGVNIKVINDLRNIDIKLGGQGAPLSPIYHHALFKEFANNLIVINIGGVCNITYISEDEKDLIAGDVCFGNAPMDDLMFKFTGKYFDEDGGMAKNGKINHNIANKFLNLDFFYEDFPKSIDRNEFLEHLDIFDDLELSDALITMIYIIAKSIKNSLSFFPTKVKKIAICGGGVKNKTLIDMITELTNLELLQDIDFNSDSLEAEAFAFLAIRYYNDLSFSFKKTTGAKTIKNRK